MKTSPLLVFLLGAPLAVVAATPSASVSDGEIPIAVEANVTESDLRNQHAAFQRAYASADRETLAQLVDDDFRYTSATGDWLDKAEFLALSRQTPRAAASTHEDVRVHAYGNVGLVHGLLVQSEPSGPAGMTRYTDVYRHDGSAWRLVSIQYSKVLDPAASALKHEAAPDHALWQGKEPVGDDDEVLGQLNAGYVQAFLDSNVAWYDAHLTADYLVVFSDGSFHDKGSLLAAAAHPVTNMRSFPTVKVSIRRFGDIALIHAENPYERTDGLKGVNRYTDIWHKRGARWLCIAAHVTRHKLPQ